MKGVWAWRAKFVDTWFIATNLSKIDLSGADLTNAILTRATLNKAYLVSADLTGAYLEKADLTGAHLDYAVFREVRNLTQRMLNDARENTRASPELDDAFCAATGRPITWSKK